MSVTIEGIEYLTVPQTAERFGCSHQWVRYLISQGSLPAIRIEQKRMLVPVAAIAKYEAYRPTSKAPVPVVPVSSTPKKRGRPLGSKNKPKEAPANTASAVSDPDEVL